MLLLEKNRKTEKNENWGKTEKSSESDGGGGSTSNVVMLQPRTQALSTTRLAGGKTLVQAGHVSPRFWEITIGTYGGLGRKMWRSSSKQYKECE